MQFAPAKAQLGHRLDCFVSSRNGADFLRIGYSRYSRIMTLINHRYSNPVSCPVYALASVAKLNRGVFGV